MQGLLEKSVVKELTRVFTELVENGHLDRYTVTPNDIDVMAMRIASDYYSAEAEASLPEDEDADN